MLISFNFVVSTEDQNESNVKIKQVISILDNLKVY